MNASPSSPPTMCTPPSGILRPRKNWRMSNALADHARFCSLIMTLIFALYTIRVSATERRSNEIKRRRIDIVTVATANSDSPMIEGLSVDEMLTTDLSMLRLGGNKNIHSPEIYPLYWFFFARKHRFTLSSLLIFNIYFMKMRQKWFYGICSLLLLLSSLLLFDTILFMHFLLYMILFVVGKKENN